MVIPALNEARVIGPLVRDLLAQGAHEVIVADGGSRDDTPGMAGRAGAVVTSAPAGRGRQLNAGAALATGEILLFLHADVRPPAGALPSLVRALGEGRGDWGAFSAAIDSRRPFLRLIYAMANVRSRLLRLPYGDQGIFTFRERFDAVGGYRDFPIMEDVDLVRRLNRTGRMVLLPERITVSARRYRREGALYTTLRNWFLLTRFLLGADPRRLASWYPHRR